ncbi:MAG TPA: hypothetical protein VKR27_00130, partial [Acidimicrobiales bacterium]|nr:hypothetical protein [Acidimicrobiales bacterium]
YTFAVRVVNATGSAHAVATWTVTAASATQPPPPVTTPPSVTITSGPGSSTSSTSASFSFAANNATAVSCRIDSGAPAPCTAPVIYTGIASGTHVFTVTATAGALATSASYSWTVGGFSANIWIDPAGSDTGSACVRSATRTAEPAATTVCATPQQACAVAHGGDVVGVAAGGYAYGFNLRNCRPASPVTFEIPPGAFAAFEGDSSINGDANVILQGDRVGQAVGFSLGKVTVVNSTNVTWNDVNAYCQPKSPWHLESFKGVSGTYCNASVTINGTVNGFTWNGGDSGNWAQCAIGGCGPTQGNNNQMNGALGGHPTDITIENVSFHDIFQLQQSDHSEMWKINDADHVSFVNDRFTACVSPVSVGTTPCDSGVIFVDCTGTCTNAGPSPDFIILIQNDFDPGIIASQKGFVMAVNYPHGREYTVTALYNTSTVALDLCDEVSNNYCKGSSSTITGAHITLVGNLWARSNSCGVAENSNHDVWFTTSSTIAARCGAHSLQDTDTTLAAVFTSGGTPDYDDTLAVGSVARGAAENAECSTLPSGADLIGKPRPTATACDAGAFQH